MTIKQLGGVFGRNPTFNDVTIEGQLTFDGDIDINSDLKISGDLEVGNNVLYVDESTGNVGINTSSPNIHGWTKALTVDTTSNTAVELSRSGVKKGAFALQGDDRIQITSFETDPVQLRTANVDRLVVSGTGDGDVTVSTGNLVIGTSGKGIDFSATAGTGTSELFDDYEEGTWTPSVSAGTISGTSITYTGNYTKIGDTVTVWFRANNSAGDIQISSYAALGTLPFTAASSGTGVVATEDIDQFSRQGFAVVLGTTLYLSAAGSATGTSNLYCSVTYRV